MKHLVFWAGLSLLATPALADYYGDYAVGSTVYVKCATMGSSGPATLSSGVISVYKDNSVTESTAGVSTTLDFDSRTGMHNIAVNTAADGTFYSAGSTFELIITTGTVSGTSFVGLSCGSFSLEARSALRPTTAGRTLDVSSGGEAGIDWANVGSPTTTLNLSGTTVAAVSGNVGGNVVGSVASVTGNVGGNVVGSVASVTGNVGGNVTGSVGSVAAGGITASSIATDAIGSDELAATAVTEIAAGLTIPTVGQIADGVWDEALSGHATAGTAGAALTSAGSAGDPWSTTLPGSYTGSQAGAILATRAASGASATLSSPVADSGTLTIKQGDDYASADNAPIDFQYSGSYDPSSPTSITLKIYRNATSVASFTGSVVGTSAPWTLRFAPTSAQTALLTARVDYRFDVEVVKNSRKRTLVEGVCAVIVD